MPMYKKKPVVIEARELKFDTKIQAEIAAWCGGKLGLDGSIIIHTLEGKMLAVTGDFIIKGVQGEFYPCKPNIFHETYEECNVL